MILLATPVRGASIIAYKYPPKVISCGYRAVRVVVLLQKAPPCMYRGWDIVGSIIAYFVIPTYPLCTIALCTRYAKL